MPNGQSTLTKCARAEPFLAHVAHLKKCPLFNIRDPRALGLGLGPAGDWVHGPNYDFFQMDRCLWTLDDDPSPPSTGSLTAADLKLGSFVVFENSRKLVDPSLLWLIGRIVKVSHKTSSVTVELWATASHHEDVAFVRDFSSWTWRPSW